MNKAQFVQHALTSKEVTLEGFENPVRIRKMSGYDYARLIDWQINLPEDLVGSKQAQVMFGVKTITACLLDDETGKPMFDDSDFDVVSALPQEVFDVLFYEAAVLSKLIPEQSEAVEEPATPAEKPAKGKK